MNIDQKAHEHLLDQALAELSGAAPPPDLVDHVLQRHHRGDGAHLQAEFDADRPGANTRWRRLLAAAMILAGIVVVTAIASWPRGATAPAPLQDPPPPAVHAPVARVFSRQDIDALPPDTREVEAHGIEDDDLRAMLRLRDLEALDVRNTDAMTLGLGLKRVLATAPKSLTHDCFALLAQFTKLRRLRLHGQSGIVFVLPGTADVTGVAERLFGPLERLPLLEELALTHFDLPPYVLASLPKLRALRRIDLAANYGVDQTVVHTLRQCRQLRALSLRACQQLHGADLAMLADLPELEELDLSLIDGINWRSGQPPDRSSALESQARRDAARPGTGVTDEALRGLAEATKLRKLDIGGGRWTHTGIAGLGACTTLRELDMFGGNGRDFAFVRQLPRELESLRVCGDYDDGFCAAVRAHFTALRHLDVSACYEITDLGVAELARIPTLRDLELRQMYGVTRACIGALSTATWLTSLDIRHWKELTPADVVTLQDALPQLRELQTGIATDDVDAARTRSRR